MLPIPESHEADDSYGPFVYRELDLLEHLTSLGTQVRAVVPSCIGLSLSTREQGVTFTVVASAEEMAFLDAVQYVDGGPCVEALETDVVVPLEEPGILEQSWELFGAAATASGVAATLSMPILRGPTMIGGFNMYAGRAHAFDGRHEQLADLLGAWAEGAVSDGDLPFRSRELARRAPELLRESTRLTVAAVLLARSRRLTQEAAEERLRVAATRAAVPLSFLVERMIDVLGD